MIMFRSFGRHNLKLSINRLSTFRACSSIPQIAVVGAGPAGFYAAQHISKALPDSTIDIYEKLPVPFGLVRFGVAPDHPEVKNCISSFSKTATKSNVNFIGNTALGRDISLDQLRANYHAVLLTYGADEDKILGVEGEHLENIIPARDVVSLYNGLPEYDQVKVNLDTETVMIVGVGNVSLDVARMILTPIDVLKNTDVTENWLEQLSKSRVKKVVIIGRRGPLDVSFTIKELRELIKLVDCRPVFNKEDFHGVKEVLKGLERPRKRLSELLYKTAVGQENLNTQETLSNVSKEWHLKLYRSPIAFMDNNSDGKVQKAVLGINIPCGNGKIKDSNKTEILECGLVIRSVGFKSTNVDPKLPFNDQKGIVPNVEGRVDGVKGLYVAGWVGTGPRGVIIDTMNTAFKVAANIVEDIKSKDSLDQKLGRSSLSQVLTESTSWDDWLKIDAEESAIGMKKGKPREKLFKVGDMLKIART